MPDLFDEYGALEYRPKRRPPKLLDPRKAPFWVLMAVVVAALCLGLCIRLTVSKKGENGAIARCRAALEAFQDLDSCYVLQESGTEGESTRNDRSPVEYWRSGVDWLRRGQTNGGTASGFLRKDGSTFQGFYDDETGNFLWTPAEVGRQRLLPWVSCYEWDGSSVTFLNREEVLDGETVTLRFDGTPYDSDHSIDGYTVCFTLDENGGLTSAELNYTKQSVLGSAPTTLVFHIRSDSPEAYAQAVDEAWQQAWQRNAGDWYLARCEEALQNFQNLDGFHVCINSQMDIRFDDTLLSSEDSATEILRCGSDCMYVLSTKNDNKTGLLYRDGQWYSMSSGLWGKGNMSNTDPWAMSWLAGFTWNNNIRFVSSDSLGDATAITVEYPDLISSSLSSLDTAVTAVFTLDADGNLLRAQRICSLYKYASDENNFYEYTIAESWEVLSTDADEIYQTITETAADAAQQIAADAPTLDRVQRALDEFHSLTDFHVVRQTTITFTGDDTVFNTKDAYWRSGADGLEINYQDDIPIGIHLYKGDYVFDYDSDDHSWSGGKVQYFGGNDPGMECHLQIPILSSEGLDHRITVLRSVEATEDGTAITVEFLDEYYDYWIMCLYLDPDGSLVGIEEKESSFWDENSSRECEYLYRILPTDPEETAAVIDAVYQEAYAAVYGEMTSDNGQ